jgi:hypothetical protein
MTKTKEQLRREKENARRRERRAEQQKEKTHEPEKLYTEDDVKVLLKKLIEAREKNPDIRIKPTREELERAEKEKKKAALLAQLKDLDAPQTHLKGKPFKFKSSSPPAEKEEPVEPKPEQQPDKGSLKVEKRGRFHWRKKTLPLYVEAPELIVEQLEPDYTTSYSQDAEIDLKKVQKNPELYIEINMVRKSRLVDAFYIFAEKKTFFYKKKEYSIKEDGIYLLPKKKGSYFMPTSFYREGKNDPVSFKQLNKGITGKALSLLYSENLYANLLFDNDEQKYNFFIVILLIGILVCWGIMYWMLFLRTGKTPVDGGVAPPISLILPWRMWI